MLSLRCLQIKHLQCMACYKPACCCVVYDVLTSRLLLQRLQPAQRRQTTSHMPTSCCILSSCRPEVLKAAMTHLACSWTSVMHAWKETCWNDQVAAA